LDVVVFTVGLSVTIFNSIEHGIFATVGMSIGLLLFRMFKAHGKFLGKVKVRSIHNELGSASSSSLEKMMNTQTEELRNIFLPLDRHDGTNPRVDLEKPYPGVYIYRFSDGFNYTNASHYLDHMVAVILEETQPTTSRRFEKPGERPWNDPTPKRRKDKDNTAPDNRPYLKAVILDFSSVYNVDLTSVQGLIDIRNQLDRYAAPQSVQWHFASVNSRWTKRALASAGFGYPSFETADGNAKHWKPIFSVAEITGAGDDMALDGDGAGTEKTQLRASVVQDVEMGPFQTAEDKITVTKMEVVSDGKPSADETARLAAVHGVNRPNFHVDVQSALRSVVAFERLQAVSSETSPEDSSNEGDQGEDGRK
jgi:solute carrier family 26 (sodium-independent sulfate anion transporter), member 11